MRVSFYLEKDDQARIDAIFVRPESRQVDKLIAACVLNKLVQETRLEGATIEDIAQTYVAAVKYYAAPGTHVDYGRRHISRLVTALGLRQCLDPKSLIKLLGLVREGL